MNNRADVPTYGTSARALAGGEVAYAELHSHTYFSLLDGSSSPEDMVAQAKAIGLHALAITDHTSISGIVRFAAAAQRAQLKAIIGAELTLMDDSHVIVLVKDLTGYVHLCQLLTLAYGHGTKDEPRISFENLASHAGGLIALSGCPQGELPRALATLTYGDHTEQPEFQAALEIGARYKAAFGAENYYVELSNHLLQIDPQRNAALRAVAEKLGVRCVATNDAHYHDASRALLHQVVTCIRHRTTLEAAGTLLRGNDEYLLKSAKQMAYIFRREIARAAEMGRPDLDPVRTSVEIAERCTFNLRDLRYDFPRPNIPSNEDAYSFLIRMVEAGKELFYPNATQEVEDRLQLELGIVRQMDLAGYLLVFKEVVDWSHDHKILCSIRGSAPASALLYCLGLCPIDPVKHNLLFERFCSPERDELPDIDLDFAHERREEVIQHTYEKYGRDCVAMVCEVNTYRTKSALRDVAKVLGLSAQRAQQLSDQVDWHDIDPARHVVAKADHGQDHGRHPRDETRTNARGAVLQNKPLTHPQSHLPVEQFHSLHTPLRVGEGRVNARADGEEEQRVGPWRVGSAHPISRPPAAESRLRNKVTRGPGGAPEILGHSANFHSPSQSILQNKQPSELPNVWGVHEGVGRSGEPPGPSGPSTSSTPGAGTKISGRLGELLLMLAEQLVDTPRHLSIHVGGMVISSRPLYHVCPIEPARMEKRTIIPWDKDDVTMLAEEFDVKLIKMDFLGLGMLSLIARCFEFVEQTTGERLQLRGFEADNEVYDVICAADTIGLFQIESRAQQSFLPRLKPRNLTEVAISVGAIRPGPGATQAGEHIVRRKWGREPITYPAPGLEKALEETYGVLLWQEQCIQVSTICAGYTPGQADQLRRAMTHKRSYERLSGLCEEVVTRMMERGHSFEVADSVRKMIVGFAGYGFPRAHAYPFAHLALISATLRHRYPAAYYAAILNCQPMGFYAPHTLIWDAARHDVPVLPVDVNRSAWECTLETTTITPWEISSLQWCCYCTRDREWRRSGRTTTAQNRAPTRPQGGDGTGQRLQSHIRARACARSIPVAPRLRRPHRLRPRNPRTPRRSRRLHPPHAHTRFLRRSRSYCHRRERDHPELLVHRYRSYCHRRERGRPRPPQQRSNCRTRRTQSASPASFASPCLRPPRHRLGHRRAGRLHPIPSPRPRRTARRGRRAPTHDRMGGSPGRLPRAGLLARPARDLLLPTPPQALGRLLRRRAAQEAQRRHRARRWARYRPSTPRERRPRCLPDPGRRDRPAQRHRLPRCLRKIALRLTRRAPHRAGRPPPAG